MATVSTTLKLIDKMSNPLGKITDRMNKLKDAAGKLNKQMARLSSGPANTVTHLNKMVAKSRQIIRLTQTINRNYQQINRAFSQTAQSQNNLNNAAQQGGKAAGSLWSKISSLSSKVIKDGAGKLKKAADKINTFKWIEKWAKKGLEIGWKSADTFISNQSRLGLIADEGQTSQELGDKIFNAAQRSRSDYLAMTANVSKLGLQAGGKFSGSGEIIAFTELMQKAFKLGGTSGADQQAGMDKVIQAMADGSLKGDAFLSIMNQAPMLAEAIANITGKSGDALMKMAEKGQITADILKAALFMAADDINQKFADLPMTFADVGQKIKDTAFKAFEPVFQKLSDWLNSEQGSTVVQTLTNAMYGAAQAAGMLLDAIIWIADAVVNHWSMIEPILVALGATLLGLILVQAAAWLAVNWPILAVVAAIAAVIYILNQLGISTEQMIGWIIGGFMVLASVIWNAIVGVFNAIIQIIWSIFFEPFISIQEWILNVMNGGFNSFGDAVKNLIGQIISWFLSLGKIVTKIIDAIFGTNWTEGLESVQDKVLKWGKNDQAITLDRNVPTIDARIDYGDAWDFGNQLGEKMLSGFGNMTKSTDEDNFLYGSGAADTIGTINKVNEVGKIGDTVDISSEDLKMMRELAEINAIQNYVTMTPTVQVTTGPISKEIDVDAMISRIETFLDEQITSSAQGVYG